jgi:4'-phosphopantetheinyl transferase EntD
VSRTARLAVALSADDGRPLALLEAALTAADRLDAGAHVGRRRRQFALGRLAADRALRRVLGRSAAVTAVGGAPVVTMDGTAPAVGVTIAHSARLAVACAWTPAGGARVGIDVERARPFDPADTYAFSARERWIVRAAGGDRHRAGIAAWVAKEAAWKALRLPRQAGPEAVELRDLRPERGRALVEARRPGFRGAVLHVRLRWIGRPDDLYVVGLARGEGCHER